MTERDSDSKKRKLAAREASRDVSWNVPDCVFLDPSQSLAVGRSALADVLMHSQKHPYMLSRRHAIFRFDSSSQQWTIEDLKVPYTPSNILFRLLCYFSLQCIIQLFLHFYLQSLNGVFINGKNRIKPFTPIPLQAKDEICLGTFVSPNELKYRFIRTASGSHMLRRVGAKPSEEAPGDIATTSPEPRATARPAVSRDLTPPLPGTSPLSPHCASRDTSLCETPPLQAPSTKRPRLEEESDQETVCSSQLQTEDSLAEEYSHASVQECVEPPKADPLSTRAQSSTETVATCVAAPTERPPPAPQASSSSPVSGVANTIKTIAQPSPSTSQSHTNVPASNSTVTSTLRPSPSVCVISPTAVIDDLFSDGAAEKCMEDVVSDAMFGEEALPKLPDSSSGHLDGTSIQIQAARDEMQKETQKLLSNIEALRSEIASKERLLVEKSEKEREAEEAKKQNEGVIGSMQEEFTCVICQELFVVAHTLSCAHSFCECCIKEWMVAKKRKDCPICRKTITTEPVHSLVLDNAIDMMVEKMDDSAKEERRQLKESRLKPATSKTGSVVVDMLAAASALGVLSRSRGSRTGPAGSSGGGSGSSRTVGSGGAVGGSGGGSGSSGTVGSGGAVGGGGSSGAVGSSRGAHSSAIARGTGSVTSPIIILSSDTPARRYRYEEQYYDISDDDSGEDTYGLSDCESEDSYDSGLSGYYYGGHGRCFNCGELYICSIHCYCI